MALEVISPANAKFLIQADFDLVGRVISLKVRNRFTPLSKAEHELHVFHIPESLDTAGETPEG